MLRTSRRRNQAIITILPDQYISRDAITFCLNAVKYKPPKGTYVYDVLMSAATELQLWTTLWRSKRKTKEKKNDTIALPINVHNIHWYLAIANLGKSEVKITILNNLDMRNKKAEEKLRNTTNKYKEKMQGQQVDKINLQQMFQMPKICTEEIS